MKVSWNLGKAKAKQDEISITIMLSITHIYIYSVYCNVCYISIPIYYMYTHIMYKLCKYDCTKYTYILSIA